MSIILAFVESVIRIDNLYKIGQMHGETGKQHPFISEPDSDVFMVAKATGLSPLEIEGWPLDLYAGYRSYLAGVSRGSRLGWGGA